MLHYYFLLFSCSLFLSLSTLLKAVPMHREGKFENEYFSPERQQAEQEAVFHQRQATELDEENSSTLQQRSQWPLAVLEQRNDLSDFEDFTSNESMELKADLSLRDLADRSKLVATDLSSFNTASLRAQQQGHISLSKESRDVSVEVQSGRTDQRVLQEYIRNRTERAMAANDVFRSAMMKTVRCEPDRREMEMVAPRSLTEEGKATCEKSLRTLNQINELPDMIEPPVNASITINKRPPKIKSLKDQLEDCEKSFSKINSGLEIAIDDLPEDDPQRPMTIAALHEASYLPMKENLEKTLALIIENRATQNRTYTINQDKTHAVFLAKLAARTIQIATQSIAVENLTPISDHESKILNASVNDTYHNFINLITVLKTSKTEIGKKLHECEIQIAKRAKNIAYEKFLNSIREQNNLRSKTNVSPKALTQVEEAWRAATSSYNECKEAFETIQVSPPITDPYEARRVAIDHIINLVPSAITIANDFKRMLNLQKK